jgi:hypothetical protein
MVLAVTRGGFAVWHWEQGLNPTRSSAGTGPLASADGHGRINLQRFRRCRRSGPKDSFTLVSFVGEVVRIGSVGDLPYGMAVWMVTSTVIRPVAKVVPSKLMQEESGIVPQAIQ